MYLVVNGVIEKRNGKEKLSDVGTISYFDVVSTCLRQRRRMRVTIHQKLSAKSVYVWINQGRVVYSVQDTLPFLTNDILF